MPDISHDQSMTPDVLDAIAAVVPAAPAMLLTNGWAQSMVAMNEAVTSFWAARVAEDMQLPQALLQCRSLPELQHLQAEYVQKAVADYQAEAGKLIALTGRMATQLRQN